LVHEAGEKTGRGYVCDDRESRRGRRLAAVLPRVWNIARVWNIIPYPWYGIALAYTHIYVCDFKSLKIIFYVITFHKFYRALFTYKK
jgi:hypothetical protein